MKEWINKIKRDYNIKYTTEKNLRSLLSDGKVLWTTRCSKTKKREKGFPEELYDSYLLHYFYRFVVKYGLKFAIVSDKYGLHFDDEELNYYNTHPKELGTEDKRKLGNIVMKKTRKRGFNKIIFYNNSPLMSKPYFEILGHSGINLYYTTTLP